MNKLKILKYGLDAIQKFHNDQITLDKGLRILSPSGTNVIEFGSELESSFIKILSEVLDDNSNWIDWYIYDNDFGMKKLTAGYDGKLKIINTPEKLLQLITT